MRNTSQNPNFRKLEFTKYFRSLNSGKFACTSGETTTFHIYYKESLAVSKNSETAVFGIYHEEALGSPYLNASTVRPQRSSAFVIAACIEGETTIFSIYHKGTLCSPLVHAPTLRLRFSVDITKQLVTCRCCIHPSQYRNFRFLL